MTTRTTNPDPRTPRLALIRRGFTMVELLIVIAIIALLVTIIMPSFNRVILAARIQKSNMRLRELCQGCEGYKQDTNLYPGQRYPIGSHTGTQVMAACLFGYDVGITGTPTVSNKYAECAGGDLTNCNGKCPSNSVWDRLNDPQMSYLYYPAHLNAAGTALEQYVEGDNTAYYTGTVSWPGGSFGAYITDPAAGNNQPRNPGTYLMIGASGDRIFGINPTPPTGTAAVCDDLTNWPK